jgi:hypothetical protein
MAPLAERIGGHLSTQVLRRVLGKMQSAPVVDFGDEVERKGILAFDQLDHRQGIQPIYECLDSWLEVGNNVPGRAWKNA